MSRATAAAIELPQRMMEVLCPRQFPNKGTVFPLLFASSSRYDEDHSRDRPWRRIDLAKPLALPIILTGLVPVAFSLAFQLSGWLSKMVAIEEQTLSMRTYGIGFGMITAIVCAAAFFLYFLTTKTARSGDDST